MSKVKLVGGQEVEIHRESPLAAGDEGFRTKLMAVSRMLDLTEIAGFETKIGQAKRDLERAGKLIGYCEEELVRKDLTPEERTKWRDKLFEVIEAQRTADERVAQLTEQVGKFERDSKDFVWDVAREVLVRQHEMTPEAADLALNFEIASRLCATTLGYTREEEGDSPLSEAPAPNETG